MAKIFFSRRERGDLITSDGSILKKVVRVRIKTEEEISDSCFYEGLGEEIANTDTPEESSVSYDWSSEN